MAGMSRIARIGAVLVTALALLNGGAAGQSFRGANGPGRPGFGGHGYGGHGGGFGFGFGFGPPAVLLPVDPPDDDAPPPRRRPHPVRVDPPGDDAPPPRRRPHPVRVEPPDDDAPPAHRRPHPVRVEPPDDDAPPHRRPHPVLVLPARDDAPPAYHRPLRRLPEAAKIVRPRPQPFVLPVQPKYARPAPMRKAPMIARLPPKPTPPVAAAALRARLPFAETRYRGGEILVEIARTTSAARIADVLARHRLSEVEAVDVQLLGLSVRRWRINDARSAAAVVAELGGEIALLRIQPNYLFAPADEIAASLTDAQYALVKMKVDPSLEEPTAAPIRVAVIDTAIDETHPDLVGAVEARFDAIGGGPAVSKDHGTAMAGGIAANGRLHGVARHVKILAARAFDADGASGTLGSTLSIVKSLDWAVSQKARVVNLSFAGPDDPTLRDALAAAHARGVALVGAVGNLGPAAQPQYPGADGHVIAATATDADDKLFSGANTGAYVAISAPGVDVLLPKPGGGYAMETGTSVSSALVTGVVALMLERQPGLAPDEIRRRLTATAAPLGGAREFGAGLVDAAKAVRR